MKKDRIKTVVVFLTALAIVGVVSIFWGCSGKDGSHGSNRKPNIVFILIDTLRADRLGMYGYHRQTSPVMDSITAEGIVFENVLSQAPWTQPAMASLFSSTYPGVHKVIDYGLADRIRKGKEKKIAVFDDRFVTLAEVLRQDGYETAGFTANILMGKEYGFAQGFDTYSDLSTKRKSNRGGAINAEALTWLRQKQSDKPFFLYLHYMDVHGAYYARDEYVDRYLQEVRQMENKTPLTAAEKRAMGYINGGFAKKVAEKNPDLAKYREFWSALYDAGIAEMDFHIGSLVDGLKNMGLWDDCYVVITADHGEELCERGLWSHGLSLHQTELHVPLILRWPGHLVAGQRVSQNVQLIDVMPTMIEQLSLDESPGMQGRSCVDIIAGTSEPTPAFCFAEAIKTGPPQLAACFDQWKLILKMDMRTRTFVSEYYNLVEDPDEKNNLAKQYSQKVKWLINAIHDQIDENKKQGQQTQVNPAEMRPEQYQKLKSLGYVE